MTTTDVLIVGGGPAGLSAATELRKLGASVTVAERESEPGGIPRHSEHLGYGMRDLRRLTTGPRYAARLVDAAERAGVDIRVGTTVLSLDGDRASVISPSGPDSITARAIVLATGVRERPRAARLIAGDRPAGVLTTGALQQFAAFHHQRVGHRAVIVGAEHVSFSAILTLRHLGCEVAAMVTEHDRHQTYRALRLATATRHRVPIRAGVSITRIVGRDRVQAVELSDGSRIRCDTVVFTGDWIPDHELARRSGVTMLDAARAPLVGPGFHLDRRGMFAIGNLVHPAETADVCALDGRAVAASIAEWLDVGIWPEPAQSITVETPLMWATYSAGSITLRVDRFVSGRIRLRTADDVITGRRRSLVPNRSITVARPPAPVMSASIV